ncbi:MAG TPA: STAS/SEC14 domain-containing protein [Methanotrichaceae archaeon]|nr:STAS/SEC14 domain-containing protein [Methanotrichaceae archaeon]
MLEKLKESSGNVVGFQMTGKLTDFDYKAMEPEFEKTIEKYGKIRLLWHLEDFHGWEPKAIWDDYEYWRKYGKNMEMVAIVGNKQWEDWMAKLAKLFLKGTKYFDESQLEDAWAWLREGASK